MFYPATIQNQRSDQFARQYYGDPYQEWLSWMINGTIDPYEEWYMNPSEFADFIIQKYGSITLPQIKTMYYTNNYQNANNISIADYDALDVDLLKYYSPLYDGFGQIFSYYRLPIDYTLITNYMVSFNFNNITVPNTFIIDEIVNITYSANETGSGQVAQFSNNNLTIQHVLGYFTPNNQSNATINAASFSIIGSESNSVINISSSSEIEYNIFSSVSNDEIIFYTPVSYYTYEYSINENNKNVKVLLPQFVANLSSQLTKTLQTPYL